jgi:enterochelin esterase-like enzyme
MGPTGLGALAVAVVVLIVLMIVTFVFWARMRGPSGVVWPIRAVMLLSCQLGAVLLAALLLNRSYDFYTSWGELFGQHPTVESRSAQIGSLDARYWPLLLQNYHLNRGTVLDTSIPGVHSHVGTKPALIYLPPQYGDPAYAHRTFPVVELFSGFPGSPRSWTHALHLASVLDQQIAAGASAPFIAVLPTINVAYPRDTECVNVVAGPQVDTYLTTDVRAAVDTLVRADRFGHGWTAMGYSTGGYCATNLAMRHPDLFSAAVSLGGYNAAPQDLTTGSLFHGNRDLADQNDTVWRATNVDNVNLQLLLINSKQDTAAYQSGLALARAARPPLQVWTLTLPRGGHNALVWDAELPAAFAWLSHFVSSPVTPIPTLDGQLPQLVTE